MDRSSTRRAITALVVAAGLALLCIPAEAAFLHEVGSDTVQYRTARCGPPIAALLGADPALGEVSVSPQLGSEPSRTSCAAVSGKRVSGALVRLRGTSVVWGLGRRPRRAIEAGPPSAIPTH